MSDINKHYTPSETESKWLNLWDKNQTFNVQSPQEADFGIALPPPNVTGDLHMGHALNSTLQDILLRYHRLKGQKVHWQVGCDHAGIGTQIVVEKQLQSKGITKEELGRNEFQKETWNWTNQHKGKIEQQYKLLGCSADWSHSNFTLNDQYSQAVQYSFFELFKQGLIYQGNRLINWCPKCLTSLSDLEVVHEDKPAHLYHIQYPLYQPVPDISEITIATSRPETLFGDVAVAIHPDDPKYSPLSQRIQQGETISLKLPLTEKLIPLVLSESVQIDFGTGALKITPAHDFNDETIAKECKITDRINIFTESATLLDLPHIPSQYHGLDRYTARQQIISDLESQGLLIHTEEYTQPTSLHDRCHTPIEPYLSDQWFVQMKGLADIAIQALKDNQVKFYPERYSKTYLSWLENIQDWCISRQLWWGHTIPVWSLPLPDNNVHDFIQNTIKNIRSIALERDYTIDLKSDIHSPSFFVGSKGQYDQFVFQVTDKSIQIVLSSSQPSLQEQLTQLHFIEETDVLDTWFSSALWPFAAQGWYQTPTPNKSAWTQVLSTAREIINLWVSRMIFSSLNLTGKLPFQDILIHPVIQTPDGKRMSKSKGNAIDPIDLVNTYGADASRMWYCSVGIFSHQDVKFPGKKNKQGQWESDTFEQNKRFINKLWNASKFVMSMTNTNQTTLKSQPVHTVNQWIISQWESTQSEALGALDQYDFSSYINILVRFFWDTYCDWYIEMAKILISQNTDNQTLIAETQSTLFTVLQQIIITLHPVIPFVTEELWNYIHNTAENSLSNCNISQLDKICVSSENTNTAQKNFNEIHMLIGCLRSVKKNIFGIADSKPISIGISLKAPTSIITTNPELLKLANTSLCETPPNLQFINKDLGCCTIKIYIPNDVSLIDRVSIIETKHQKIEQELKKISTLLNNPGFLNNASPDKVEECKTNIQQYQQELNELSEYKEQIAQIL